MQGGQYGNPFIFKNIIQYLKTGIKPKETSKKELLDVMIEHINLEVQEKGEYTGIREIRKHLAYYTKGLENSSYIRNKINILQTKKDLIGVLTEYFSDYLNI